MPASKPPEPLFIGRRATPIGEAVLVWDAAARLRAFDWSDHEPRMRVLLARHYGAVRPTEAAVPAALAAALDAYFAGDLRALDDLACETAGTPFQRKVWAALRDIPAGRTESYGQLAARIGHPTAVRAVGLANGSNPISIVVPCHRVIGADGSLTGYGGGLDRKRWLLAHEGAAVRLAA
jgi:methylated-DNA-[protein]-cysteine S-methyltransferase